MLGQAHHPTAQQAEVIGAAPGPMLVVAGAGAGKTETMAARVVWLVANGYARPEEILGLTFTRKAAQQLSRRIRDRLGTLAGIPALTDIDPTGRLSASLESITPTVSTYDAFAGSLVAEFGLLYPVEPSARTIGMTELFQIARRVVAGHTRAMTGNPNPATVTDNLLSLVGELDNHLITATELKQETDAFTALIDELPKGPRQRGDGMTKKLLRVKNTQLLRVDYLSLIEELAEEMRRRAVTTFGEKMSQAARLATAHPRIGQAMRRRYRVVMLDEYQDTSHAQRVLLTGLFGGCDPGLTVTAVGDPMQSIYGWRGATAANLERFTTDFPLLDDTGSPVGPAPKKQLTVSWRNPGTILRAANMVADTVLGDSTSPRRAVQPLTPRDGAPAGTLTVGWYPTEKDEHAAIAEALKNIRDDAAARGELDLWTAAVLIRANKQAAGLSAALDRAGVANDIVGVGGLLHVPEIADLVAVLTMLVRPGNNTAALRILAGPMVDLGLADIVAVGRRATNLAARARRDGAPETPTDPSGDGDSDITGWETNRAERRFAAQLAGIIPAAATCGAGLVDAIADLGEPERYSEQGYTRLVRLGQLLRRLRTMTAGRPVVDAVAVVDKEIGLRQEVLARADPAAEGVAGTRHLDRFISYAAQFSDTPGADLASFIDYLSLAEDKEQALNQPEVPSAPGRVQILTVHKAKGLEWHTVVVPGASNSNYPDQSWESKRTTTWLTDITAVPSTLRGDAGQDGEDPATASAPVLDVTAVEDLSQLQKAIDEHPRAYREADMEEATRLFYVALTRSESTLFVTGSPSPGRTHSGPADALVAMKKHFPDCVSSWWDGEADPAADDSSVPAGDAADDIAEALSTRPETTVAGVFPIDHLGDRRAGITTGLQAVGAALDRLPELSDHPVHTRWEEDVTFLIDEHRRRQSSLIEVVLPDDLSASDLVALKKDPDSFARRLARPVPFKPNRFAKRGTALHRWLEKRFGGQTMLDFDELPGSGEPDATAEKLEQLKAAFLASEWADRQPVRVEQPFAVTIGGTLVRGRMDAVFHFCDQPDTGWMVVDWKTGKVPVGADMEAAQVQLAVYRYAWAKLVSQSTGTQVPADKVRAAFFYIGANKTIEPSTLPGVEELARLIGGPAATPTTD
ncbi:ATP-dependent helicase [Corynebacterium sp. CCM 8862]|uniref:DNA 3'-5' helicase n=2 Tax=Corynebacterium mendelii TaxID=2765362 RepID=A0A939E2E6_9CORY|nr:UvrD-helicase domain-containing protein [Corynebacterium mendelii]MBN9644446.1 ATP-dependent helicase [Corynebacterium mendelii]